MAINGELLQGEVVLDPHSEDKDLELMLAGFLFSLLKESPDYQENGNSAESMAAQ